MLNRPAARLGAAFVFPLEQGEPPSTEHGPDINALSRYALFVCKYLGENDVMMKAETLVVLGGAGFAKWAAGLPIASELFDSEIEPFGPTPRRSGHLPPPRTSASIGVLVVKADKRIKCAHAQPGRIQTCRRRRPSIGCNDLR